MMYDRENDPPLPTIETARLRLVPLDRDHVEGLFAIYGNAETVRYWDTPAHEELIYTQIMMGSQFKHYRPGSWTIFLRATEEIIGAMLIDVRMVPSMGYIIRAGDWRKGYGTEAMTAALDYLFTRAGIDRMELWIMADNIASQQLALKLGFTQHGKIYQKFAHLPQMHETQIYGLRAADWWARRASMGIASVSALSTVPFYRVEPELRVRDVVETGEYYRDILGFHVDYWADPEFVRVSRGEWTTECVTLRIHHADNPPTPGSLYIHVGLEVDKLYDDYAAKGVTIVEPLHNQPERRREFTIEDINGWRLTFSAFR